MRRAYAERLASRRARLGAAASLLGAVSYRGVLARGFALVRDEADLPLRRAAEVSQSERLRIEFADGLVAAVADGRAPEAPGAPKRVPLDPLPPRPKRTRSRGGFEGQGSLF
jgi:exodeoxyribonuclease VII large subunit